MGWKVKVVIGLLLLMLSMWWTRYQPIGASGNYVHVVDRLTGKFWFLIGTPKGGLAIRTEVWIDEDKVERRKRVEK